MCECIRVEGCFSLSVCVCKAVNKKNARRGNTLVDGQKCRGGQKNYKIIMLCYICVSACNSMVGVFLCKQGMRAKKWSPKLVKYVDFFINAISLSIEL